MKFEKVLVLVLVNAVVFDVDDELVVVDDTLLLVDDEVLLELLVKEVVEFEDVVEFDDVVEFEEVVEFVVLDDNEVLLVLLEFDVLLVE